MPDRRWTDADQELVGAALAGRVPYSRHGQHCPVWVRRPKGVQTGDGRTPTLAELERCDCWRMEWARQDAAAVLDALTAAGWRPGAGEALDDLLAARTARTRTDTAEEIAAALEHFQPEAAKLDIRYGTAMEHAATVARLHATTPTEGDQDGA